MDIERIPPDGDPFYAKAPPKAPREHPHACWHGLIFLTYTVFDEELGEEIEETEAIPCRRCAEEAEEDRIPGDILAIATAEISAGYVQELDI